MSPTQYMLHGMFPWFVGLIIFYFHLRKRKGQPFKKNKKQKNSGIAFL